VTSGNEFFLHPAGPKSCTGFEAAVLISEDGAAYWLDSWTRIRGSVPQAVASVCSIIGTEQNYEEFCLLDITPCSLPLLLGGILLGLHFNP
jgi:hypothetical protein